MAPIQRLPNRSGSAACSAAPDAADGIYVRAHGIGSASSVSSSQSDIAVQVALPAGSYRLKELPGRLAPWAFTGATGAQLNPFVLSKVGVQVPKDVTVQVLAGTQAAAAAAAMGARVGLVSRLVNAVAAMLAAIWSALRWLLRLPLQAASPLNTQNIHHAAPTGLLIEPSTPLKGTLNGLPSWLAHQRIAGLSYDAAGKGTLLGSVYLFNLLPLPGLTSSLYPSFMRVVLPPLDLNPANHMAQALSGYQPSLQDVAVSYAEDGSLFLAPTGKAKPLFGLRAQALRLRVSDVELEANAHKAKTTGKVYSDVFSDGSVKTVQAQWRAELVGDLHRGVATEASPLALKARVDLGLEPSVSDELVKFASVKISARNNGKQSHLFVAIEPAIGDVAVSDGSGIHLLERPPLAPDVVAGWTKQLGLPTAALLHSVPKLCVGTVVNGDIEQARAHLFGHAPRKGRVWRPTEDALVAQAVSVPSKPTQPIMQKVAEPTSAFIVELDDDEEDGPWFDALESLPDDSMGSVPTAAHQTDAAKIEVAESAIDALASRVSSTLTLVDEPSAFDAKAIAGQCASDPGANT